MKGTHLVPVLTLMAAGVILGGCSSTQTEEIVGAPEGVGAYSTSNQGNAAAQGNSTTAPTSSASQTTGSQGGSEALPSDNVQSDQCNVSELEGYAGKPGNQQIFSEILQRSGASIQRVLTPQTIATMDYRAERVDIHVDGSGRITQLSCG